ncbi:hypothetical protein C4D60_Mb10t20190 [Musa balbisiana]|uniref:Uncharacterized protein n=1 Tax=Musa balbisiana TaxID=52838 RepID=A0A4S8IZX0_MUSBA|nr:hypothetical protein C4D60_Mb10t20190 [Musa balbisiana]
MQPALSNSSSALLSSLSLSASCLSCRSEISVVLPIRLSLSFTGNHLLPLLSCPRAVADADQKEAEQPDKGTHSRPFLFPQIVFFRCSPSQQGLRRPGRRR